ncbi:hypothetical protein Pfo_007570 [Paulownia fortunei]|nr:hypothetical protein Pfo_007570 [Paulownia fortunei]
MPPCLPPCCLEAIILELSSSGTAAMKVIAWCVNEFRFYVFSKAILFILGLIFSCGLVEVALFSILITYITDEWKHQNLPKAAAVVNLHEGTYAVLQIFFAFVADAYSGLFTMVVCSTTIYIVGLSLFCVAGRVEELLDLRIFYTALVLVTFSQAAIKISLKAFLGDQLLARDQPTTEEEEERACSRSKFWWNCVSLLAFIVAVFGPSKIGPFKLLSMALAIPMGAAFLWFLLGTKFYIRAKPTGSPLSDVIFVIHTAVTKRKVEYPQTPEQLFKNSSGLVQVLPHVSWLRWLDRAAVVVQEQEKPGHVCTVEQVKGVKFLLKMLPIWTTFLTFSLVVATGSTFFLEEATKINIDFPILYFIALWRFTKFMVAEISDYVLEKLEKKKKFFAQRMMLVRIGIGMICCVLCCIAARINAVHWLHLVKIDGQPEEPMNIYRLTPQFVLLGVMEGLSGDGLENFFDSQVSKSTARYGPPFGDCVEGVGKFLSVICILILSTWFKWFKDDINSSRLDKYYAVLTILSFANMIIYWLVAYWYGDERFLAEDGEDIEMANSVQALQKDSLGPPLVSGSLFNKGQYKSFSGRRTLPIPAESSFGDDHLTENTNSEQLSKPQEDSLPLLNLETCQETASSSSVLPDNRCDDQEAERLKPDVTDSTDQVSPLVSESTMDDGPSDAPLLNGVRSFSRLSSRGIHKRFHSMH